MRKNVNASFNRKVSSLPTFQSQVHGSSHIPIWQQFPNHRNEPGKPWTPLENQPYRILAFKNHYHMALPTALFSKWEEKDAHGMIPAASVTCWLRVTYNVMYSDVCNVKKRHILCLFLGVISEIPLKAWGPLSDVTVCESWMNNPLLHHLAPPFLHGVCGFSSWIKKAHWITAIPSRKMVLLDHDRVEMIVHAPRFPFARQKTERHMLMWKVHGCKELENCDCLCHCKTSGARTGGGIGLALD